jgi:hypothetical protein
VFSNVIQRYNTDAVLPIRPLLVAHFVHGKDEIGWYSFNNLNCLMENCFNLYWCHREARALHWDYDTQLQPGFSRKHMSERSFIQCDVKLIADELLDIVCRQRARVCINSFDFIDQLGMLLLVENRWFSVMRRSLTFFEISPVILLFIVKMEIQNLARDRELLTWFHRLPFNWNRVIRSNS